MGCHTWHYRKLERTQEEAKQSCLAALKRGRNLCWKIYNNPTNYRGINWKTTKKEQFYHIKIYNRKIKAVCNNYYQKAIWNNQNDKGLTIYVDGKGLYIADTGFHDSFRKYGYPDNMLFSLEETLKYIDDKNNSCETYENTFKRLKEFWNKYPEGLIEFG